jgi:Predicted membrane protein
MELKSPFSIIPALKFGMFFAAVILVAQAANTYFGEAGIYATSIFSGLADVDAITLTMSTMSIKELLETNTAVTAITLAAMSNTIVKFAIAYIFGIPRFGKWVGAIFGAMILAGGATLLIL